MSQEICLNTVRLVVLVFGLVLFSVFLLLDGGGGGSR